MIDPKDLRIDTYTNASNDVWMYITHMPTGVQVGSAGKSPFLLKKQLLEELEEYLNKTA